VHLGIRRFGEHRRHLNRQPARRGKPLVVAAGLHQIAIGQPGMYAGGKNFAEFRQRLRWQFFGAEFDQGSILFMSLPSPFLHIGKPRASREL
jgi:hypothetical protein